MTAPAFHVVLSPAPGSGHFQWLEEDLRTGLAGTQHFLGAVSAASGEGCLPKETGEREPRNTSSGQPQGRGSKRLRAQRDFRNYLQCLDRIHVPSKIRNT